MTNTSPRASASPTASKTGIADGISSARVYIHQALVDDGMRPTSVRPPSMGARTADTCARCGYAITNMP